MGLPICSSRASGGICDHLPVVANDWGDIDGEYGYKLTASCDGAACDKLGP